MHFNILKKLIESGETEKFIEIISQNPSYNLLERDKEYSCSLLDWGAICNQVEIVHFLCKRKPELLIPLEKKRSPIHYAARHGSLESLKVLLEQSANLELKDYDQKTPLDLAIQHEHTECARLLMNHGAALPIQPNLQQLIKLINPCNYILYCNRGNCYQLLTQAEIDLLETQADLSTLSLNRKKSYAKKPYYSLRIDEEHLEDTLLKLIDKYLYLCNRIFKESREGKHGADNLEIQKRVQLSKEKRESLLKIIRLIVLANQIDDLDARYLIDDKKAERHLRDFIHEKQNIQKRYFGDDLSDNSDSEDEKAYLGHLSKPQASTDAEIDIHVKTKSKQTSRFWLKTKLDTLQHQGLKKKLTEISSQIKKKVNPEILPEKLSELVTKTLNSSLQERGKIEYKNSSETETLKLIREINACVDLKKLEALLKKCKPIFVIGARGINYMLDRWSADARRYHRRIDERQQPQFSEAVLKTLSYDYYADLDESHDFHQNPEKNIALQTEALRLSTFLQALNKTPPCIGRSANHTSGDYIFSSVGDYLQDHFSNGVDTYLDELATKRKEYPNYWGKHLKNSFNPGMAIGSRPYHALKYTFGLKNYYPRSMLPRYWQDGTIEYSHVGKVYLSLHPLQEIFSADGPNNLSMQDRQARVSLGDQISPEKELSFLGFMPGDRVFHHFVAKFPSFKGAWKNIYQIKYGLDKETYEAFQYLISATLPESDERNSVINLLAEWLCAYHEVLLIEMAKEEALRRGGILVYVDRDGKLSLEPENGRIFTRGEKNLKLRNEIHTLRELRIQLAAKVQQKQEDTKLPGFVFTEVDYVMKMLPMLLKDKAFLAKITHQMKLSTIQEGSVATKTTSENAIKSQFGAQIIQDLIKYGLFTQSSFGAYTKQITYISNQEHLYTDIEINTLLQKNLEKINDVDIYAAQHPLVRGELGEQSRAFFNGELRRIFKSQNTAVMPIEVSQEELNEDAFLNMNGIHWNGLVISKIETNKFKIELIDPAHSLKNDTDLTNLTIEEINNSSKTISQLVKLIRQAATASQVTIQIHWLVTQQQAGDLDCGAWTVDNLIQRAQGLSLRTRDDVTGAELRNQHDIKYTQQLSFRASTLAKHQ